MGFGTKSEDKDMLKRNENIVARVVHDTFFLIDIKQNYFDNKCSLYEINEMGYFIWCCIPEAGDVKEIAKRIEQEVDNQIDLNCVIDDVNFFLDALKREGYIVEDGRD